MIALLNGCGCDQHHDCGCGGHGGLAGVSDAAAIAAAAESAHGVTPNDSLEQDLEAVANAMPYPMWQEQYIPGTADCAAASGGGVAPLQLVGQAAGAAGVGGGTLALVPAIATSVPLLGPIIGAVAGIIGLFSQIFAHHAQAVAKEQNVLCAAVPAAANYLQIIETAVGNGQATPAEAIQALNSLLNDFTAKVQPIIKMGSQCNAACWKVLELDVAVRSATEIYSQMPPPAPPVVAAPDPAATDSTIPEVVAGPSGTTAVQAAAVAAAATPSWFDEPSTMLPSLTYGELAIGAVLAAGVMWRMGAR